MGKKLWFYDFDRTLCSHAFPTPGEQLTEKDKFVYWLTNPKILTAEDKPLKAAQWHVDNRSKEDALFCLTHQTSNLRDEYVHNFLCTHYNNRLRLLTVASPELKITMIKAMAHVHLVQLSDCYLIEDRMNTVYMACEAGINGVHISSIYTEYEACLSRNKG